MKLIELTSNYVNERVIHCICFAMFAHRCAHHKFRHVRSSSCFVSQIEYILYFTLSLCRVILPTLHALCMYMYIGENGGKFEDAIPLNARCINCRASLWSFTVQKCNHIASKWSYRNWGRKRVVLYFHKDQFCV